ncbi:hypothetical protein C8R44DRAFT_173581 [Mycena epipterygia]|nr:hypothetical protein C8R44DRAFT_173581 [Mycena epipterygia]
MSRLLALTSLLVSATALQIVPPGLKGLGVNNALASDNTTAPMPDHAAIVAAVTQVDQKAGVTSDAAPNADVPPTIVTAVDGTLTNTTVADVPTGGTRRRNAGRFGKRDDGFKEIFAPQDATQHDAAIEGTAYLTYTLVPNSTYNVDACLDWCAGINGCVFVNIYYEFNNPLLDFVFPEKSNLRCAAYADLHTAAEKTNFGGKALYPHAGNKPAPLNYFSQSSCWGLDSLIDPADPEGYELVFGPTDGANNAPGFMGFAFLDKYDVNACAQLCNTRGADPNGGGCAYFNIWRAVVSGIPTTYTCSMYYLPTDESTAVNTGQGSLVVTYSRGYKRTSLLPDGGFEAFDDCDDFCLTASDATWVGTSPSNGNLDASIFWFPSFAHTGNSVALLGAAFGDDTLAGTLTPAAPLKTKKGTGYVIQAFMNSNFAGVDGEADAKVDILWNGKRVGGVSGFMPWTLVQVAVTGTGSDKLSFVGGTAPAWTFIDDVFVYEGPVAN